MNDFEKIFSGLDHSFNPFQHWQDFIVLSACTISNRCAGNKREEREALYLRTAKDHSDSDINSYAKMLAVLSLEYEKNPDQDFLGHMYMTLGFGNKNTGQFFTPYNVCKMCAQMSVGKEDLLRHIQDGRGAIPFHDCCVGGGAMLIASVNSVREVLKETPYNWQFYVLCVGQDIDFGTAMMAYVQLSLLGTAGMIKVGDSLCNPISSSDDPAEYWYTPMYCTSVWQYRKLFKMLDAMTVSSQKVPAQAKTEGETEQLTFEDFEVKNAI